MAVVNEAGRTTQYRNSRTLYYPDDALAGDQSRRPLRT